MRPVVALILKPGVNPGDLLFQAGPSGCGKSVRKGGVISIVGVYGPTNSLMPIGSGLNKGPTIRGNLSLPKFCPSVRSNGFLTIWVRPTIRGNQAPVQRHLPRLIDHVMNGILRPVYASGFRKGGLAGLRALVKRLVLKLSE